jgi:hypothetical protein
MKNEYFENYISNDFESKERKINIYPNYLPIILSFFNEDGELKEYILKTNNEKTKLLLNKKD